jgi:hypothetical protein
VCQNVLAVTADTGEVLGLVDQILHHRAQVSKQETLDQHRNRESRESLLWIRGTCHLPAAANLIDVSDQGSDTFEFLEHELQSGRRFVIRACKQRKVSMGHVAADAPQLLSQAVDQLPELGRFTMDIQAQPGRKARKNAEFIVRGSSVLVYPPHVKQGHHGNEPLAMYLVQALEAIPPAGQKAVDWKLLTNEPIQTMDDAWRALGWYEGRWVVEEYHKAQKTGCQIEDLQFTTIARLEPAIAMLSIVALSLLNLREAGRRPDAKTRLATTVFAPDYVAVLSDWRHGEPRVNWTVHEFHLALARLGGHQNRKSDRRPGWLVLWRGWAKLQAMLDGYDAAKRNKCGKT